MVRIYDKPLMSGLIQKSAYAILSLTLAVVLLTVVCDKNREQSLHLDYKEVIKNGHLANQGLKRSLAFVKAWLHHADPETGLIPRNLKKEFSGSTKIESDSYWDCNYWNAEDCAADNYSFMVLTTSITDHDIFNNQMLNMLYTEKKLTSRIGKLPDTYSFSMNDFLYDKPDINRIIFGSSEYVKDGLMPLTEWLGESPWSQRMIEIVDDMWKYAPVETKYGKMVSTNIEVNGEMLQVLSRLYWFTGHIKYLEWAMRLGDYYLLGRQHPTRNLDKLRLRNHGCEIISGLCELYATVSYVYPEKKHAYHDPLHTMLQRILQVGRNEHGLFYNEINPQSGEILDSGIADTWAYPLNGYYTVYLIDKEQDYLDAILKAMNSLNLHYRNYKWEKESADGYADAIEGALNLFNRQPVSSLADWIDSEIKVMWSKQQTNGMIEGWHSDGNFARTTIMYSLWKSAGITIQPWREDVVYGAIFKNGVLKIFLTANQDWQGKMIFDSRRHKMTMNLPFDWPRINQFPEWFTVDKDTTYTIINLITSAKTSYVGNDLQAGIDINLQANESYFFELK